MTFACDLPLEDLIAYDDDELGGARLEYVDAHLTVCSVCRARLARFRETATILREGTPLRDDPEGRARLRARLEREATRRATWQPPRSLLLAIASLLLIALLVSARPAAASVELTRFVRDLADLSGLRSPADGSGLEPARSAVEAGTLSFPIIAPERLAPDLPLVARTVIAPDLLQAIYRAEDGRVIRFSQGYAAESPVTVPASAALLVIDNTEVLWQPDLDRGAVARAAWVRDGIVFELDVLARRSTGLSLAETEQIVRALLAEQDRVRR